MSSQSRAVTRDHGTRIALHLGESNKVRDTRNLKCALASASASTASTVGSANGTRELPCRRLTRQMHIIAVHCWQRQRSHKRILCGEHPFKTHHAQCCACYRLGRLIRHTHRGFLSQTTLLPHQRTFNCACSSTDQIIVPPPSPRLPASHCPYILHITSALTANSTPIAVSPHRRIAASPHRRTTPHRRHTRASQHQSPNSPAATLCRRKHDRPLAAAFAFVTLGATQG